MPEEDKKKTWLKPRLLTQILAFCFLLNGSKSHGAHPYELEIPSSKRTGNAERYISHRSAGNETICNEDVILNAGFDKMLHWIFNNEVEKGGRSCRRGRSLKFKLGERFAFRKRLQFALLPIMYKMGVMTTLLTGLTVLVLKGLGIGVILLIFAFGNYFTKLHKHSHQSAQPIHVHVHSQDGHKVTSFPSGIGPWDRATDEVHPSAYLGDNDLESYRRRLIQNSAAMVKFQPTS